MGTVSLRRRASGQTMSRDQAVTASRHGAYAAFVSAAVTTAMVLFAMLLGTDEGVFAMFNDPLILADIVLILACGFGMLKQSRAAAVTIFVYFVYAKIFIGLETQSIAGIGGGLVFLYFFGRAIQGSFACHRIAKAEDPGYKAAPKWLLWIGIPSGIVVVILLSLGLMTMTGLVPSTEVVSGGELYDREYRQLVNEGIINAGEVVEYFYSDGVTSVLEAGNILTHQRAIRYFADENGDLVIYELYFEDIASITLLEPGSFFQDSLYEITGHDPDVWFRMALSAENEGDIKFAEALRAKLQNQKQYNQEDTL